MEEFAGPVVSILEDDEDLRALIEASLVQRGYFTAAFACGSDYLATFDPNQAGCLVLDLRLRDMDGRDLLRALRLRGGRQPVIVVTGSRIVEEVIEVMRMGALDILAKPVELETLAARVAQAVTIDVEGRQRLRSQLSVAERLAQLTPREREVAELVSRGMITKEIALQLGISRKTVEVHRSRVVQKLGADSVAQVVRMVVNHLPGIELTELPRPNLAPPEQAPPVA